MDEADNRFIEATIVAAGIIVTHNVRDFAKPDLAKHGWEVMTPVELTSLFNRSPNHGDSVFTHEG